MGHELVGLLTLTLAALANYVDVLERHEDVGRSRRILLFQVEQLAEGLMAFMGDGVQYHSGGCTYRRDGNRLMARIGRGHEEYDLVHARSEKVPNAVVNRFLVGVDRLVSEKIIPELFRQPVG